MALVEYFSEMASSQRSVRSIVSPNIDITLNKCFFLNEKERKTLLERLLIYSNYIWIKFCALLCYFSNLMLKDFFLLAFSSNIYCLSSSIQWPRAKELFHWWCRQEQGRTRVRKCIAGLQLKCFVIQINIHSTFPVALAVNHPTPKRTLCWGMPSVKSLPISITHGLCTQQNCNFKRAEFQHND